MSPQTPSYVQKTAVPKNGRSPVWHVTQLDEDSFRVELPQPRSRGLVTLFCSKAVFFSRYDLVEANSLAPK